jgi:hypothetical protein
LFFCFLSPQEHFVRAGSSCFRPAPETVFDLKQKMAGKWQLPRPDTKGDAKSRMLRLQVNNDKIILCVCVCVCARVCVSSCDWTRVFCPAGTRVLHAGLDLSLSLSLSLVLLLTPCLPLPLPSLPHSLSSDSSFYVLSYRLILFRHADTYVYIRCDWSVSHTVIYHRTKFY